MKEYKGYYIDKAIFNNEKEIDVFLKTQAIEAYKQAVKWFAEKSSMEMCIYCEEKAETLVSQFGFAWDEVEALEIETLEAIA